MAEKLEIRVPDIGDFTDVDVVEVLVKAGDRVAADDSLITLETDKASMEVPAPAAGVVSEVRLKVGAKVSAGDLILTLESAAAEKTTASSDDAPPAQAQRQAEPRTDPPAPAKAAAESHAVRATSDKAEPRTERPAASAQYDCELLVLGSGPGGYTAAFRAADLGLQVIMVERYAALGGVCLNVGCIPSKALLHAAKVIAEAATFAEHGIGFGQPEIDLERLRRWKEDVVGRLSGGVTQLAKRRKVEVVQGVGRFVGPHQLEVTGDDGKRRLSFAQAIVAVGSRAARIPGLPYDDPRVLDSTSALELADIPERLLVIGGGIIGLEMATVYDALGARVTVVELLDRLMTGCDRELVRVLEQRIRKRYEAIRLGTRVSAVVAESAGLVVAFDGRDGAAPAEDRFDRVLVAVGRRPNGGEIGAEDAGVRVDERGFIPVDEQMRTNVAHIFAIGDVAREPLLAHKAMHEGKVAAEVAAGLKSGFDARVVPSVAYTDPEVAWVGLTEEEAKAKGIEVEKGVYPWAASGRNLALGRDDGATRLLFERASGRLVGAGIVGTNAGELIAEVGHAIEMGSDATDLALTIHAHPTLSETIGQAAEVSEGTVTDIYVRKRGRN